jgi:hypothetical protein
MTEENVDQTNERFVSIDIKQSDASNNQSDAGNNQSDASNNDLIQTTKSNIDKCNEDSKNAYMRWTKLGYMFVQLLSSILALSFVIKGSAPQWMNNIWCVFPICNFIMGILLVLLIICGVTKKLADGYKSYETLWGLTVFAILIAEITYSGILMVIYNPHYYFRALIIIIYPWTIIFVLYLTISLIKHIVQMCKNKSFSVSDVETIEYMNNIKNRTCIALYICIMYALAMYYFVCITFIPYADRYSDAYLGLLTFAFVSHSIKSILMSMLLCGLPESRLCIDKITYVLGFVEYVVYMVALGIYILDDCLTHIQCVGIKVMGIEGLMIQLVAIFLMLLLNEPTMKYMFHRSFIRIVKRFMIYNYLKVSS